MSCARAASSSSLSLRAKMTVWKAVRSLKLPEAEQGSTRSIINFGYCRIARGKIAPERLRAFEHLFPAFESNPAFDLLQSHRYDESLGIGLAGRFFENRREAAESEGEVPLLQGRDRTQEGRFAAVGVFGEFRQQAVERGQCGFPIGQLDLGSAQPVKHRG